MIIDEKFITLPTTPYLAGSSSSVRSSPYASSVALPNLRRRKGHTLTSLPAHILLQIIHDTFPHNQPQAPTYTPAHLVTGYRYTPYNGQAVFINHEDYETLAERQRKTLFWISTNLRLVSRQLYTACMHVLRSTYFQAYTALVRPGYSSDPFPMGIPSAPVPARASNASSSAGGSSRQRLPPPEEAPPPAYRAPSPSPSSRSAGSSKTRASTFSASPETESPLVTPQRETHVLDRFILVKLRADIFADESSLHQDSDDGFRDIFDVAQPRARLEDLVRMYGAQDGVVYVPGWSNAAAAGGGASRMQRDTSPSSSAGSLPLQQREEIPTAIPEPSSPLSPVAAGKKRRNLFSFRRKATSPASPISPPQSPSPSSINVGGSRTSTSSNLSDSRPTRVTPIAFPLLSISFSPRKVGLVLKRSRTIVEVPRSPGRKESLESLAQALVRQLRVVLEEGGYPIS